jgi:hypothetical protein
MKRGYKKRLLDAALNWQEKTGIAVNHDKRQLTIETHKVFVVYRRGSLQGWCVECAELVEMLRPEDAAAFLRISLRTVFRRVEAEKLHFLETTDGLLFICRNSLTKTSEDVVRK